MSKKKGVISKIIAMLLAVAMCVGVLGTAIVGAAPIVPDKGNLYIHSYNIPDMKYAGESGDGNEVAVPENAVPMTDIEFKIYKLDTNAKYPASGKCDVNNLTSPDKVTDFDGNKFDISFTTSVTTNDEGVALASDLEKGVYLVIEQKNEKVARPSAPYLVSVPMTNSTNDGWITDVHTYPKNNDMSISKEVDKTSVSIGEIVTWTLKPTAGSSVKDSKQYDITDKLDKALDFVENSVVVYGINDDNKVLIDESMYAVSINDENLLTVSFNDNGRRLIPDYDSLEIAFKTKTNKQILERVNYTVFNTASIILDNEYGQTTKRDSNVVNIHTAGINVLKTDEKGEPLSSAKFKIASSKANAEDEKYLKIDKDGNILDINDDGYDKADELEITTNKSGHAVFKGIKDYDSNGKYQTYYLVETSAPNGYSLLGVPVKAEFTSDNSKESTSYTIEIKIKNSKIPKLPQTGGNGTWMYSTAGIAILALGFVVILLGVKRKTENR